MRTTTTALAAALAAAVATGAALLTPAAAQAATGPHSETHVDPAADVAAFANAGSNAGTITPAPTRTQGDVLTFTSNHASYTVRLSARLGALVRPPAGSSYGGAYGFAVNTSAGRHYVAVLDLVGTSGTRFRAHLERAYGGNVSCRLTGSINATTRTVSVVVPRSCIGRPAWVRTGFGSVASADSSSSRLYVDDARRTGVDQRTLAEFPTVGPRLYH